MSKTRITTPIIQHQEKRKLIILASTFPRWPNDSVPLFVYDYAIRIRGMFANVFVIAPHVKSAKIRETMGGLKVKRFRYFWPYSQENIAYGQFKKNDNIFGRVKSICYISSQFFVTFGSIIRLRGAVINAHWLIPQGFVAILVRSFTRSKVVVSVHGGDVFMLNGKVMRRVKRFVLKNADQVVVNSSATAEACRDLWPSKDYHIVPMGIDIERFARKGTKKAKSAQVFNVLFVGRIVPEKGAIYLCEAVKMMVDNGYDDVRLDIIGEGSERKSLEKYVEKNNLTHNVFFLGWRQQEELPKYYFAADVFAGPSIEHESGWKEAFGLVFAEASASGLPVISTSTGGVRDIIINNETGYLVPQKNAAAIYEKLCLLRNDPSLRKKLGEQGAKRIKEKFSWEKVIENYVKILSTL